MLRLSLRRPGRPGARLPGAAPRVQRGAWGGPRWTRAARLPTGAAVPQDAPLRPIAVLFANLKGNVGDLAILEAMLRDLGARFPGRRVDLFPHPFLPVDEARVAAFRAASGLDPQVAGRAYAAPVPRLLRRLHRRGWGRWLQGREIARLAARAAGDARRFAAYEAVAVAGGDQWGGDRLGIAMFGTLAAVSAHAAVAAYPFSLNPAERDRNTDAALRAHFARLRAPLLVRDSLSLGTARDIGLSAVLRPDCVFGLGPLARAIPPMAGRDPARTLLVVTRSPEGDAGHLNRAALDALGHGRGRVELMTTCALEDGEALRALGRELGVPVHEPLTWQDAVAEMRAAGAVVANRLHALILGAMAGATMVPLADRRKALAFVRDVGLDHHAPAAGAVTEALVAGARADAPAIAARLRAFAAEAAGRVESPFAGAPEEAR